MDDLKRSLAPITGAAWQEIDAEASRVLRANLAARKLVDFTGPLGDEHGSVSLGRTQSVNPPITDGVQAQVRRVLPLTELCYYFSLDRKELEDINRGSADPDLEPLIQAALQMARAEDIALFQGYQAASIDGIASASPHAALTISEDYEEYPRTVSEATRLLRSAGVEGPYAIALGPRCYDGLLTATSKGGFPVLDLVKRFLDGPVIWAPAIDGAVVMSTRGGDYELIVGRDFSIGYNGHTDKQVKFFLYESLTFRVLAPEAGVKLAYAS